MRRFSDWGNVKAKKLNGVSRKGYKIALRDPSPGMKRGGEGKVFKQADSQRLVLLLKEERTSARMSLLRLTISKSLSWSMCGMGAGVD